MILNKDKVVLWLPSRCGEKMSCLQEEKKRYFCILPLRFGYGMLIFGTILGLLLFSWYLTPPSDWAKTPNYLAMYINFIITMPVDAFLTISTGPGNAISRLVILAYGFPIFLIVLHWMGRISALYKLLRWDSSRFRYPLKTIFICAFLSSFSHIFTDMWIHPVSGYIRWPFIVLENNPVYLGQWGIAVNIAMVVLSAYALILWH